MKYERRITIYFPIDVANPREYNEKTLKTGKSMINVKKNAICFAVS